MPRWSASRNAGFEAEAPNRPHVADITYVRMANGSFGHTAFVTDVFARRIVGWACATTMDTRELPLQALEQAMSWAASHVCFCKLASTVWALFFGSIGGWFPAETAPSEPAAPFSLVIWS